MSNEHVMRVGRHYEIEMSLFCANHIHTSAKPDLAPIPAILSEY
jgi:hypothetical protein